MTGDASAVQRPAAMTFLEARRLASLPSEATRVPLRFSLSGTGEQFDVFLRAAAARRGLAVEPMFLAFGTLSQSLLDASAGAHEVMLLLPWDFVPELDWRSGSPSTPVSAAELRTRAEQAADRIRVRGARLLYLPAPLPPLLSHPDDDAALATWLVALAQSLGATLVAPEAFSLSTYFSSGCPVGGQGLGSVAGMAIDAAFAPRVERRKLLVTDLDQVMWSGVLGDDGPTGVQCAPEGRGYRHFVYQSLLARLRREGVLIAAVSRNDPEPVQEVLASGRLLLGADDFVSVTASYHAKSVQIAELATRLNLGLASVVFVDDNPIELAEVGAALPEVECIPFPSRDDAFPAMLAQLARAFGTRSVTAEDRERTAMYRSRVAGLTPVDAAGADLTEFLRGLEMTLHVHDRTANDRTRAVQLINKTNQFNINGFRRSDAEIGGMLAAGGRLFTASLTDRFGAHGEILACLIDAEGTIQSLVLSCRVFQRRVEHAFLAWLAAQEPAPRALAVAVTERNTPARELFGEGLFPMIADGVRAFDAPAVHKQFVEWMSLFAMHVPGAPDRPAFELQGDPATATG